MVSESRFGAASWWGVIGVVALLVQAVVKLFPLALELTERTLSVVELAVLALWIAMSAYSEGYRGFHRQFSPRVVARAAHLRRRATPVQLVLAPLFCMGLFHATRKRLIISWVLTLSIVAVVIFVRSLSQPWRGIIDAGVVVGLSIGIVSIGFFVVRALRGHAMPVPADLPDTVIET